jgi:hypothetical protein
MSDPKPPPSGLARFRARLTGHEGTKFVSPEASAIHARVDQLSELELRDVMTPRVDVAYLSLSGHARGDRRGGARHRPLVFSRRE